MDYQEYFKSPYYSFANQELDWLNMDTKKLYRHNLNKRRNLLEQHNWIEKKFTYRFNSEGFRCDEFEENQDSIVFLGCSFTVGLGLPIETVWTSLVAEKLGLKCYNLGIGGGSCDTAFRLGYHYIPKLKPKIVVLLIPYSNRFELFDRTQNFVQYGPWNEDFYYKKWVSANANCKINQLKNKLALSAVCDSNSVKFISFECDAIKQLDLARDLVHRGIKSNRAFSKQVLKSLK
jgi:hypothetical protein